MKKTALLTLAFLTLICFPAYARSLSISGTWKIVGSDKTISFDQKKKTVTTEGHTVPFTAEEEDADGQTMKMKFTLPNKGEKNLHVFQSDSVFIYLTIPNPDGSEEKRIALRTGLTFKDPEKYINHFPWGGAYSSKSIHLDIEREEGKLGEDNETISFKPISKNPKNRAFDFNGDIVVMYMLHDSAAALCPAVEKDGKAVKVNGKYVANLEDSRCGFLTIWADPPEEDDGSWGNPGIKQFPLGLTLEDAIDNGAIVSDNPNATHQSMNWLKAKWEAVLLFESQEVATVVLQTKLQEHPAQAIIDLTDGWDSKPLNISISGKEDIEMFKLAADGADDEALSQEIEKAMATFKGMKKGTMTIVFCPVDTFNEIVSVVAAKGDEDAVIANNAATDMYILQLDKDEDKLMLMHSTFGTMSK